MSVEAVSFIDGIPAAYALIPLNQIANKNNTSSFFVIGQIRKIKIKSG
ncbi:MAG: hypothetical protein WCP92_07155 [bacterium]